MAPCKRCKKHGLNKKQCPKGNICKICIREVQELINSYFKSKRKIGKNLSIRNIIFLKDKKRKINPWVGFLPKIQNRT